MMILRFCSKFNNCFGLCSAMPGVPATLLRGAGLIIFDDEALSRTFTWFAKSVVGTIFESVKWTVFSNMSRVTHSSPLT